MTKKRNWILLAIGLAFAFLLVITASIRTQSKMAREREEEMARQRNDAIIADTEWPEGWTGSRQDSILFAKTQDKNIRQEDDKLRNTRWPSGRSFIDREDSLQFALTQDEDDRKEREARAQELREQRAREQEARVRRASFTWSTTWFTNQWGERSSNGAMSRSVTADSPMGWPYSNVKAQLFVQCSRSASWIRFTESPNLTAGDAQAGGYDVIRLRVRIDGNDTVWRTTQEWGDDDIRLPSIARSTFARAQTFRINLPWYGQGNVVFTWDLTGASEMISEACGQ